MNKLMGIEASLLMASSFAFTQAGWADSSQASCEFYKHGDKKHDRWGSCSFSQRQGYIDIKLKDGSSYSLSPRDDANQFKDQEGNKVDRTQSSGNRQVYEWHNDQQKLVVNFKGSAAAAPANADAKIHARIETWGKACKNRVAEQFDAPMSDIHVSVGATEQTAIDAGQMTLQDIQKYGLSFNWEVKHSGKKANGYCNTDGQGNVTEFKQQ